MSKLYLCAYCDGQLEPVQHLRFLVETDNLDNPTFLARIRQMPSVNGRPLPVCKACHEWMGTELRPAPKPKARPRAPVVPLALTASAFGFFGVFGALSVGLILNSLFNPRG